MAAHHSVQPKVYMYCRSELYSLVIRQTRCLDLNFTNVYAINNEVSAAVISGILSVFGHTIYYADGNTTSVLQKPLFFNTSTTKYTLVTFKKYEGKVYG